MFNSIQKENLSQRIIGAIKDHISENGLKPGDRLATEREMSEAFGVSRSSVREAVKILEAIGVLESRPKHGISVREFDPQALFKYLSFAPYIDKETIIEMLELRQTVDLGIVELAIERVTEDGLEAMRQHVAGMRKTLERPVEFYTHDWAFHFEIYEATRNPSIQALGRVLSEFFVTAHREWWDREVIEPEHFENHERILLALEVRDPDGMRQAVRAHFDTVRRQWVRRGEFSQVEATLPSDRKSIGT